MFTWSAFTRVLLEMELNNPLFPYGCHLPFFKHSRLMSAYVFCGTGDTFEIYIYVQINEMSFLCLGFISRVTMKTPQHDGTTLKRSWQVHF